MLSPGRWHEAVPKDPVKNRQFRLATLRRCRTDLDFRAAILHACKHDIVLWINLFAMQYNPKRLGSEVEPFVCWDFQEAALHVTLKRLFGDQRRVIWEKSRELGATWLALIIFLWACLFHDYKKFLAISHSEQAVDRGADKDTLFWKIWFMLEHLPDWMKRGVVRRKLGFYFPATDSSINGAATTERSGVGGRATAVLLDEFSKHTKDREIEGQMADTGPCLIIGTHYGTGTAFYGMTQRADACKVVMHWSQHPDKKKGLYKVEPGTGQVDILDWGYDFGEYKFVTDGSPTGGPYPGVRSPWYDAECIERANARNVAMHLDIDPQGSVTQFFDPLFIHQMIARYAMAPVWVGDLAHDRETGEPGRYVPAPGGPLQLWKPPPADGKWLGDFVAGSDLSSGSGATPSVIMILDAKTGEKVGEYVIPSMYPEKFGVLAVALCRSFNHAFLAWEQQGPGEVFGLTVVGLGYRRIWYKTDDSHFPPVVSDKPGWYPHPNAKRVLLEDYRDALAKGEFVNRSEYAMLETLSFKYGSDGNPVHSNEATGLGDPSAARVNHADRVIADGLACKMLREVGLLNAQSQRKADAEPPFMSYAWRREQRQKQRNESMSDVWDG